jgi:ankyrin
MCRVVVPEEGRGIRVPPTGTTIDESLWARLQELDNKCNLLFSAVARGSVDTVSRLIADGINVDVRGEDGNLTPLMLAVISGQEDVVKLLLEHGAHIHARGPGGYTPLHMACHTEYGLSVSRLLLEKGADVNAATYDGCTPLLVACLHGCISLLGLLLEHGGDVNHVETNGRTVLHYACMRGKGADVVRCILQRCDETLVGGTDGEGHTAMHMTVVSDCVETVQLLLQAGLDINQTNDTGAALLHLACMKPGRLQFVQWLVEHGGSDIGAVDLNGRAALDLARMKGLSEVATWLEGRLSL